MKEYLHEIQIDKQIKPRMVGYLLVETDNSEYKPGLNILKDGIKNFFGGFGQKASIFNFGRYLFALLEPEEEHPLKAHGLVREGQDVAFIEGTFYKLDFTPFEKNKPAGPQLASNILSTARSGNYENLKEINGRYTGFVYLNNSDTLIVFNDQLGCNRVFIYNNGNRFALSNNIFALASNPALKVSINEQAIAEILHIEYPLFRRTEFNEISLTIPSDILIRTAKTISYRRYFQKFDRSKRMSDKSYVENLRQVYDNFFKHLAGKIDNPLGFFMSKGKDSRAFLPFLLKNDIPFNPFVFKDKTGVFDYPYVREIVSLLEKDLHVLESFKVDQRLVFMISMNTTPTFSWGALGSLVSGYTDTALIGMSGDKFSGKMPSFRMPGIKTKEDMMRGFFKFISNGVTSEIFQQSIPYFSNYSVWDEYTRLFGEYPQTEILFDSESLFDTDYLSFRNAHSILLRSQHFLTPVTPYAESSIYNAYNSLPENLIRTQKAHALIAASESKSNSIRSTAFPISLKTESHLRSAILRIVKFNNKFNNLLLKWQIKKFNPYLGNEQFKPRSDYFKELYNGPAPVNPGHERLLTRMRNADEYLHLVFHDDIRAFCHMPEIIYNETEEIDK